MKRKFSKVFAVGMTAALLVGLFVTSAIPVAAADAGWSKMSLPTVKAGGTLSSGTLGVVTQAVDGTLYTVDSSGTGNKDLFSSTNGGYSWSATGFNVAVTIIAIATSPTDASVLYVTDGTNVWKSADTGATFTVMDLLPGGNITSIDVADIGNGKYAVVAGTNVTGTEDVYTFDESDGLFPNWVAQNIDDDALVGTTDSVMAVAFSPDFANDRTIVAITTGTTTIVTFKVGSGAFGAATIGSVALQDHGSTTVDNITRADIAFPSGFNAITSNVFFIGITGDGSPAGDVYQIYGGTTSVAVDLNANGSASNLDIHSLDVSGAAASATILAGTTGGTVRRSLNGGASWSTVLKQPTGTGTVSVVLGTAGMLAIGAGTEGGASLSVDSGATWNGVSLIQTTIASINDMTITSDGSTIFVATTATAGSDSIWRYASNWERVYHDTTYADADLVELSPDGTAVFAANLTGTVIYKSTDNGQRWIIQTTSNNPGAITGWVVIDANTIITGAASDVVYHTNNNGLYWTATTIGGNPGSIVSFALEPGYDGSTYNDILAGGSLGEVAKSSDGGATWASSKTTGLNTSNNAYPAFDADYANNGVYYATGTEANTDSGGVARYSSSFALIDVPANVAGQGTTPVLAEYPVDNGTGIVSGADGTLYVTDVSSAVTANNTVEAEGGMFRSLNPRDSVATTSTSKPYWEWAGEYGTTVLAGQTFMGLWTTTGSTKLWTIDTTGKALYHYTDTLSTMVVQTGPANAAVMSSTSSATLTWDAVSGATSYQVQVDTRVDFDGSPKTVTYYTYDLLKAKVSSLGAGSTYYWRVRVAGNGTVGTAGEGAPVRSYWSTVRSFTMEIATTTVAAPLTGSINQPVQPAFAWGTGAPGTTSYNFELSTDPGFATVLHSKNTNDPYYALPITLEYSTVYYWRVQTVSSSGNPSDWTQYIFTTESEPAGPVVLEPVVIPPAEITFPDIIVTSPTVTVTIPTAETPGYIWGIIGIGAALVIAVIILIVRTRRVV